MKNSPGQQELVVTLTNVEGTSRFDLTYLLRDNDFTRRWAAHLKKSLDNQDTIQQDGVFYGRIFYDKAELVREMREATQIINARWPGAVTHFPRDEMDQAHLSRMHAEFERIELQPGFQAAPEDVRKASLRLNLLIHQYEGFFYPAENAHIAINFDNVSRVDFKPEDYELFEPRLRAGSLTLSYGMTGVPVHSAFATDHPLRPVPQSNFTAGMELYFHGGEMVADRAALERWLPRWDMDPRDPTLAIGYIRLGELHPQSPPMDVLRGKLRAHPKVAAVSLGKPAAPWAEAATWPTDPEIFRQLQVTPYILVPHTFDHEACHREAQALLDRFVTHRNYDQASADGTAGQWKSLAIHALDGDSTKTLNFPEYGVKDPSYRLSEIADSCPQTLAFLNQFTDLKQCQRVRFMLLEPGAEIKVHSDGQGKDVTLAYNIALNMPEGCEFHTALLSDGTAGLNTRRIPIRDGSIFLFNNSPYHRVRNASAVPRIHLIVHGPARICDETLVQAARAQNGTFTGKELVNRLARSRAAAGRAIERELHDELCLAGIQPDFLPESLAPGIFDDEIADPRLRHESLHLITVASLYPLNHEVVAGRTLDEWLGRQADLGRAVAALVGAGTRVLSCVTFPLELLRAVHELHKNRSMLMGQIINHAKEIPYFHEQFLMVDLKRWDQLGRPSLGEPYGTQKIDFPEHQVSPENFHDGYTPHWLGPGNTTPRRRGRAGLGTVAMARSLEAGLTVINVPMDLRREKQFTYPRAGRPKQYQAVREGIDEFLAAESRKVYVFNNERPRIRGYGMFAPEVVLAPCAGLKIFGLFQQFQRDEGPRRAVFIDYSRPATEHFKALLRAGSAQEVFEILSAELRRQTGHPGAARLAEENFSRWLNEVVNGDASRFEALLNRVRASHSISCGDFISDHRLVLDALTPGTKTLFWHSNAWSSNASLYVRSAQELEQNYEDLGRSIMNKLGIKGWRHRFQWEMVFGESLHRPQVILTDGCDITPAPDADFRPLR